MIRRNGRLKKRAAGPRGGGKKGVLLCQIVGKKSRRKRLSKGKLRGKKKCRIRDQRGRGKKVKRGFVFIN